MEKKGTKQDLVFTDEELRELEESRRNRSSVSRPGRPRRKTIRRSIRIPTDVTGRQPPPEASPTSTKTFRSRTKTLPMMIAGAPTDVRGLKPATQITLESPSETTGPIPPPPVVAAAGGEVEVSKPIRVPLPPPTNKSERTPALENQRGSTPQVEDNRKTPPAIPNKPVAAEQNKAAAEPAAVVPEPAIEASTATPPAPTPPSPEAPTMSLQDAVSMEDDDGVPVFEAIDPVATPSSAKTPTAELQETFDLADGWGTQEEGPIERSTTESTADWTENLPEAGMSRVDPERDAERSNRVAVLLSALRAPAPKKPQQGAAVGAKGALRQRSTSELEEVDIEEIQELEDVPVELPELEDSLELEGEELATELEVEPEELGTEELEVVEPSVEVAPDKRDTKAVAAEEVEQSEVVPKREEVKAEAVEPEEVEVEAVDPEAVEPVEVEAEEIEPEEIEPVEIEAEEIEAEEIEAEEIEPVEIEPEELEPEELQTEVFRREVEPEDEPTDRIALEKSDEAIAPPPVPSAPEPFEAGLVDTPVSEIALGATKEDDGILTSAPPDDDAEEELPDLRLSPETANEPQPPAEPPAVPVEPPAVETPPTPPQPAAEDAAYRTAPTMPIEQARRPRAWFEEIFDEDYLRTLPKVPRKTLVAEVNFIEECLQPAPEAEILDVGCGIGRQAIELASRGYHVTGFDRSLPLLIRAADEAQARNVKVNFVQSDFREIGYEERFDAVYCVSTSFGYFDDDTNRKMISCINAALKPGGRFLLDVVNRDYVIRDLPARVWWEGEGCVVLEEVDFNYFTSRIVSKRSVVLEDGRHLEQEISSRCYSLHELGKILHHAGFRVLEVSGHIMHRTRFFGNRSAALLMLAEKRASS